LNEMECSVRTMLKRSTNKTVTIFSRGKAVGVLQGALCSGIEGLCEVGCGSQGGASCVAVSSGAACRG